MHASSMQLVDDHKMTGDTGLELTMRHMVLAVQWS